jgi:hypothetical protein
MEDELTLTLSWTDRVSGDHAYSLSFRHPDSLASYNHTMLADSR